MNAAWKCTPSFRPDASSRAGIATPSSVPGITVLRSATTCPGARSARAAPISRQTRSTYPRSIPPLGELGVPTQTSDRSASRTAEAALSATRRRPAATASRISGASPGSSTGARPSASWRRFTSETSIPTTRCPSRARHAAETHPTYPRPKTAMSYVRSVSVMSPSPGRGSGRSSGSSRPNRRGATTRARSPRAGRKARGPSGDARRRRRARRGPPARRRGRSPRP